MYSLFFILVPGIKSLKFQLHLYFSKCHGLVACGGEDGAVECFDIRERSSIGRIDATGPSGDIDQVLVSLFYYCPYKFRES